MGSEYSNSTINALNDNFSKANKIQTQYYNQVFTEHKISSLEFKEKLRSIRKRLTYLQYGWARELQDFIKLSNKDKLYTEYKSTLKENCFRQGKKEKLFCPINFKKSFLRGISQKTQSCITNMTIQDLNTIIEECKSFLMVTCWLHQLVTLQKKIENQTQVQIKKVTLSCQTMEIYEILLNLAQKYYKQLFKLDGTQPAVKITDMNIREVIASLQKARGFCQRQLTIVNLLKVIQSCKESSIRSFIGVCQALGKSNVAAHLHIIREVGTYQAYNAEKYLHLCINGYADYKNDFSSHSLS